MAQNKAGVTKVLRQAGSSLEAERFTRRGGRRAAEDRKGVTGRAGLSTTAPLGA